MTIEIQRPKYYQKYHEHTSYSNTQTKDSPITEKDYWNDIRERFIDYPEIFSTMEHGYQGNYFKIYNKLEKYNKKYSTPYLDKEKMIPNPNYNPKFIPIKFIFGTEAYWVKDRGVLTREETNEDGELEIIEYKDRANCHIVILARNEKGRRAINKALTIANKTGYYYKPRLDLELILSLPKDDVLITTACIAFWNKYSDIDDIVLKLNDHFTYFFLEVQAHNTTPQKEINSHISELSKQYGIPLIAGTDSHVIHNSQLQDRTDYLESNNMFYEDEEGWYLDVPDCETFIQRFEEQGVLSTEEIYSAINNTNLILEFEDIVLDRYLKVPVMKKYQHLSQEERNEIFVNILRDEWLLQEDDINQDKYDEYIDEIKHSIEEIEGCNMADYFTLNYEIMKLGQEKGGVLTDSGRGSAVSMIINKLMRFTKVDRINSQVLMFPERFLTKERVLDSKTPPDIDHNVSDRKPFVEAQRELLGEKSTYDLVAFGTLKYKSAFKMYARAYDIEPQVANEVSKQIAKYEKALHYAEEIDKKHIDVFDYVDKEKFGYLIEGCQRYLGIIDSAKIHPCACIAFDGDVEEEIGLMLCRSETTGNEGLVALIESDTIDSFGYLKQDYLIVDSVGLISDIYEEIGIEPLTVNQLLDKICGDKKVWDIYSKGYTMCINQVEQDSTSKKAQRYKPQNISELTQFIAGIRPSFKTMYKTFENREHFEYGIKTFDNLIKDEFCESSFILYQEHLMKVLGFAGFKMGETYTIIKAISKKKEEVIYSAKEKFVPNFAKAIMETGETHNEDHALELAREVWKIIEDSAKYGFNSAHAYCMAIDSVTLAYLKAYFPLETYKVMLQRFTNKGEKDRVSLIKKEMLRFGITLNPLKFREDNRTFTIDYTTKSINQTMASIKDMQKTTPENLYNARNKIFEDNFEFLHWLVHGSGLNKTNIDILIKLDYFSEFGEIHELLDQLEVFNKFGVSKILSKNKLSELELQCVSGCYEKETEKQYRGINNRKFVGNILQSIDKPETYLLDKVSYQAMYLGYSDIIDTSLEDNIYAITEIDVNQWGTPFFILYQVSTGETERIKVDRKWYRKVDVIEGDIIEGAIREKFKSVLVGVDENNKNIWEKTDEVEKFLKVYTVI